MNYLEKNKNAFLEDLKKLIKVESYLTDPKVYPTKELKDAVKLFSSMGEREGIRTYSDPEGYYGYMEIGQGDEMIAILGHLDVVPPGDDLAKWNTPPFEMVVEGDLIKGRGTQDDKGPLMVALYLLKSLLESGVELNKRIRIIYPTDEESFWRGIEKYKSDNHETPVYGFTPDATFPLIYSERELYEFKIIGQPTNDFEIKAGAALNVVPEEAMLKIGDESKSYEGRASHAMSPWNGDNAIYKLLKENDINHELLKFVKDEVNYEYNGESFFGRLIKDDDEQLSFNLATLNINSEIAEIGIDIRIPNTSNTDELEKIIKSKLENYPTLSYEFYDRLQGVFTPIDSKLSQTMINAYQTVTNDFETKPIATGGATYARGMDNIVAFGPFFNDSPKTEHQYNEYVRFSDFVKAFDIYEKVIYDLLK